MPTDRSIDYFNFINLPYTRAEEMVKITAEFIAELAKTRDVSMFQSAFGFMNNDIPFTMLITRKAGDEPETYEYTVRLEVNDWGTFQIEDDDLYWPAKEWSLNGSANLHAVPNWKDLSAYEIYKRITIMTRNYGVAKITGDDATPLIDMIYHMLIEEYVEGMRPQDWPCDILDAHVAMIYSENHAEEIK